MTHSLGTKPDVPKQNENIWAGEKNLCAHFSYQTLLLDRQKSSQLLFLKSQCKLCLRAVRLSPNLKILKEFALLILPPSFPGTTQVTSCPAERGQSCIPEEASQREALSKPGTCSCAWQSKLYSKKNRETVRKTRQLSSSLEKQEGLKRKKQ